MTVSELSHLLQAYETSSGMHFCCVTLTEELWIWSVLLLWCACSLWTAPTASASAQVRLWERMNQVIKIKKGPDRNVWWDLHCWMASRLTLMTKWDTTIYTIFAVFSMWLFPPPPFYFELLLEVRVAIRCLNIFKHKVETVRWHSQILIQTFQEGQEWTTPSSSEWGPLARANLTTEGTWSFKAT